MFRIFSGIKLHPCILDEGVERRIRVEPCGQWSAMCGRAGGGDKK
jgi:hypothetical protein